MFAINVWLTVTEPRNIETVRGLMAQAVALSRREPGCLRYEVYHSQADATRFLLCEHWESEAAWVAHRSEKAFTEVYQPHVLPLVTREPHISTMVE